MRTESMPRSDRATGFALFLIVFSLSLLAWSGTLHTSDGLAMYAVSDSLVRYGTWDIESIRWMGLQQGTFGPDGLLYSRKGLAISLIALPLVWAGYHLPLLGPVHAASLLTPILHALTAVYLYKTVRLLMPEAGQRHALLVAGLWAFGSMAFAYVKTWFSEPAVALAMIAALYHLLAFREGRAARSVLAMGAWLGFSLLTRSANAIVFPFYGLALLAIELGEGSFRNTLNALTRPYGDNEGGDHKSLRACALHTPLQKVMLLGALFLTPIIISGLIYLWYNNLRFGNPFESGYIEGEEFTAIWWQGIWGQTFSFGRGLLWYTPWVVLSVVGGWRWRKREPLPLFVASGSTLTYILFYGKWYLWSGGFAWGPRFLVPILPLLALMTAPLLEMGRKWRRAWWVLALAGFGVNLIGVLYDFNLYQAWLDSQGLPLFAWETFANPAYAQIPNLLRLGLADFNHLDLAWVVTNDLPLSLTLLGILLAIVLAGGAAGAFLYKRRAGFTAYIVAAGAVLLFLALWLTRLYQVEQIEMVQLPDRFLTHASDSDAQFWYDSPELSATILNQVKGDWRITGFFVDGATLDTETEARASALAQRGVPIHLLSDGPDRAHHGLDLLLKQHLFWVRDEPLEGQSGTMRLTSYWQGALSDPIAYNNERFTFADGSAITLEQARVTPMVANGGVLALELSWRASGALPPTTQIFVQLTDSGGNRVAQKDGALGDSDLTQLRENEPLTSRHALVVAPDEGGTLTPGSYTLHFGLYRYDTLERATLLTGANELTIPITVTE